LGSEPEAWAYVKADREKWDGRVQALTMVALFADEEAAAAAARHVLQSDLHNMIQLGSGNYTFGSLQLPYVLGFATDDGVENYFATGNEEDRFLAPVQLMRQPITILQFAVGAQLRATAAFAVGECVVSTTRSLKKVLRADGPISSLLVLRSRKTLH
jgi:hypothetical protein